MRTVLILVATHFARCFLYLPASTPYIPHFGMCLWIFRLCRTTQRISCCAMSLALKSNGRIMRPWLLTQFCDAAGFFMPFTPTRCSSQPRSRSLLHYQRSSVGSFGRFSELRMSTAQTFNGSGPRAMCHYHTRLLPAGQAHR